MSAPILTQASTAKEATTKEQATGKEKEKKTGNATNAQPNTPSRSDAPATLPEPAVLSQTAKTHEAVAVQTMIGGPASESPVILPETRTAGPITSTPSQTPEVALPNFQSTSLAPGPLSPSGALLSSASDLAFALRLTWKAPASATEAAPHSGPNAVPLGAPDSSPSNGVATPNDKPATVSEAGANIDLLHTENKRAAIPAPRPFVALSSPEGPEPVSSGFSSLQPASGRPTGADPMLRDGVECRSFEVPPVIRPWNASAVSARQNRGTVTADQNSSITASSKMPSIPQILVKSADLDAQSEGLTKSAARVPAKTAPDSGELAPSRDVTPRAATQIERSMPKAQDTDETALDETETPRRLPGSTSTMIVAIRPGTPANDSGNPTDPNTKNAAGDSESDGKTSKALPTQKFSEIQNTREHPGMPAEGVVLGQPAEPTAAPNSRAKISAAQASQPLTDPPETGATHTVPSQPIREVSLRLAVATSTYVDVQLAERAGKVQVAVRTPDQDLAKSLQTNLGELVGRLEEKGFKTDVWTPIAAQHDGLAVREPLTSGDSQSHSDGSGSQGGQPDSRGGRQEPDQRQQGRWKALFEESFPAPMQPTK
jgi:hypothetical protein